MKTKLLLILVIVTLMGCSNEEKIEPNTPIIENTASKEQMPTAMMCTPEGFVMNTEGSQIIESNISVAENNSYDDYKPDITMRSPESLETYIKDGAEYFGFSISFSPSKSAGLCCELFHNGQPVRSDEKLSIVVKSGHMSVLIKNISDSDAGVYTMKISNNWGSASTNFILRIQ